MSAKLHPTFEVDKKGMSMVFARKGKAFIITDYFKALERLGAKAVELALADPSLFDIEVA